MRLEEFVKGVGETRLLYLDDSYVKEFNASILRSYLEDRKSIYIILDETAFHPKGGGQPTDTGSINGSNFRVAVRKVMLVRGVAVHWGKPLEGEVKDGSVVGTVDWEPRYLYMRRHTAGHLYDHCLSVSNGRPVETLDSWLGDPCYIAYEGDVPPLDILKSAESLGKQMISKGGRVSVEEVSREELIRRVPNAPNIYRIPVLKSYRMVTIEGCDPIPCAGTHLNDIRELGSFSIKNTEKIDKGFRIYFDVKQQSET